MRKNFKRLTAILMAILMATVICIPVMAGEGGQSQGEQPQGSQPGTEGTPGESEGEPVGQGGPGGPGGQGESGGQGGQGESGGQGGPGEQGGQGESGGQGGPGGPGGSGGGASQPDSYDAVYEYSEEVLIEGETISSTGANENAILISGGTVELKDITVDRTSSDSTGGDSSSFYGVGAAILATSGTAVIDNATITTNSAGGAGIFAYGDSVIYVSDTNISTQQGTSGGIHAAGGGTLIANNVTAVTNGGSSAAIRSDRGGGTMIVDGGSFTSNGTGSPAIYCTAEIAVNEADLIATNSEAICIEGKNSIYLYDCNLSGNMPEQKQNDCDWNVILYQSMSGDSQIGNSTFQMVGGTLSAENGGMFYTTNTQSTFILSDVSITYAEDSDFFLKVTGNANQRGWGSSGKNGAQCTFTAIDQEMEGNIIWDSISTLDLYMANSSLKGSLVNDESNAGDGGDGYASLYLDAESLWIVTGDSFLTTLYAEGTIVDEQDNPVSIIGTDGTVYVAGTSEYTITVNTYGKDADMSGASVITDWSEFEKASD